MKINTQATNLEMTPAISDYLSKKLGMVDKYVADDDGAMCDIEIGRTTNHHRTGDVYKAEANLTTRGEQFYAIAEKDNLYAAIDEMKDEIVQVLSKSKARRMSLLKRGGQAIKDMFRRN